MKGIFELRTAADLYRKLGADYETLAAAPTNSYAAYNFFVTAWHLLEWTYPNDRSTRDQIRNLNPVLQVCEHLAVGAKHLSPSDPKLTAVEQTGQTSHWPRGYWHPNYWARGYWRDALTVELAGAARDRFGAQIDVLPLAEEVMTFWKENRDLPRVGPESEPCAPPRTVRRTPDSDRRGAGPPPGGFPLGRSQVIPESAYREGFSASRTVGESLSACDTSIEICQRCVGDNALPKPGIPVSRMPCVTFQ